jgi:hypothetical protein
MKNIKKEKMKNFVLALWHFPLRLWYNYKSWRYEQKCLKYFGSKPEKIVLSAEDYDALVERLNQPPDPKVVERFREILNKKAPWD